MKKSRLLFAVLAFVLVVALVACGGEKQPDVTEDPSTAATTTAGADVATTTKADAVTTTNAPATTTVDQSKCTVSYTVDGEAKTASVSKGKSFTLTAPSTDMASLRKGIYKKFLGYFAGDVQVTDENGKKLSSYTLENDIAVEAKYETVDYNPLFVQDNLMYHVSFLHARYDEVLENFGKASGGKSAYDAFELFSAEEEFFMQSRNPAPDTIPSGKDYYVGAPTFGYGYLQLGRIHEDGKNVYTPLAFSFKVGDVLSYYDSDYSIQMVAAAAIPGGTNRVTRLYFGDFRASFSWGLGSLSMIEVRKDGFNYNGDFKDTAISKFFNCNDENSFYQTETSQKYFKTTDAVTFTFSMDKDFTDEDKSYVYKDADYGGKNNTAYDGTPLTYSGRFTLKAYLGNIEMGGVKEHSTLGKNYFKNNTLFTFAETNTEVKDGINFYAFRYYNDILEPADIDRNNFADIAYACLLDISEFNKASDAAKAEVYAAFANITLNNITSEYAQLILDTILSQSAAK